jgi:hypothetical protein
MQGGNKKYILNFDWKESRVDTTSTPRPSTDGKINAFERIH